MQLAEDRMDAVEAKLREYLTAAVSFNQRGFNARAWIRLARQLARLPANTEEWYLGFFTSKTIMHRDDLHQQALDYIVRHARAAIAEEIGLCQNSASSVTTAKSGSRSIRRRSISTSLISPPAPCDPRPLQTILPLSTLPPPPPPKGNDSLPFASATIATHTKEAQP